MNDRQRSQDHGRRSRARSRRRSWSIALVGLVAALAAWMIAPVPAGAVNHQSSSPSRSIDVCIVLPGFATPGDSFRLHTTGPNGFDETASFRASACGSYAQVPSGKYTLAQSDTASGWHLAQIYCFAAGSADHPTGSVDLASGSATVKVNQPTTCLFTELPGGSGGPGPQGTGTPGSSSKSGGSTTSTTNKSSTPTGSGGTSPPFHTRVPFCVLHPTLCKVPPVLG